MALQNWNDVTVAKKWDAKGGQNNPTRSEQLDILVTLMKNMYKPGHWMLDLGYGSGKVEELIFKTIPNAHILGVDGSEAMMALAKDRLAAYSEQFVSKKHDLSQLSSLELPNYPYQFIFAVQSLHHLDPELTPETYKHLYSLLETGGSFFLVDKVQVETPALFESMRMVWERLDQLNGSNVGNREGHSFPEHLESLKERGDLPLPLDEHLKLLKQAGFEAACLHLHGHRALIIGCKA